MKLYHDFQSDSLSIKGFDTDVTFISPDQDMGVFLIPVDNAESLFNPPWADKFHDWALEKLQTNKAKVLFWTKYERIDWIRHFKDLHQSLRAYKIPPSSILVWHASYNLNDSQNHGRIDIINDWSSWATRVPPQKDAVPEHNTRSKHFLCFNRVTRKHRLELLGYMISHQLLPKTHMSFGPVHPQWRREYALASAWAPLELDTPDWDDDDYFIENHGLGYYQDSYINITCETNLDQPVFLSEKIWKPILNFQPFILISARGTLAALQELGFKTWAPWIREDYDGWHDDLARTNIIHAEIKRLSSKSLEELAVMRREMHDHLLHNYQHFWKIDHDHAYKQLTRIIEST